MKKPFIKKKKSVLPVKSLEDAQMQFEWAKALYAETCNSETYAALCRAYMVMQTKIIENRK